MCLKECDLSTHQRSQPWGGGGGRRGIFFELVIAREQLTKWSQAGGTCGRRGEGSNNYHGNPSTLAVTNFRQILIRCLAVLALSLPPPPPAAYLQDFVEKWQSTVSHKGFFISISRDLLSSSPFSHVRTSCMYNIPPPPLFPGKRSTSPFFLLLRGETPENDSA